MFVLHHGWRSSASRRVRLCLAEKGLKFESVLVDLTKMEHHSPAYLKLNPNGVIPLLILPDGRSLYESGTICEYLDETYPEPPLRPDDAYGRAEMRNWICYADERIGNLIIFNWKHSIAKIASKWTDAELKLTLMLDKMEASLGQHAWLVGERYSLADIAVVPFVKRMDEEIIPDEMSAAKHPRVHAWWKKLQARPAFKEARIESFTSTL